MRARVMVPAGADNAAMQAAAESAVAKWIDGKTVVKAICVPGKLSSTWWSNNGSNWDLAGEAHRNLMETLW